MTAKLRALWRRLPSWLRAAATTAAQSAAGTIALIVLDVLDDFRNVITGTPGAEVDLVDAGNAALAAVIGAASGLVAAVHRRLRPPEAAYPSGGQP